MKVGKLVRSFKQLGLLETTDLFYQGPEQPTFYKGRHQINAVWISPSLRPCASSMALFYLGAGDHRVFIVDFPMEYIIGSRFVLMCYSSMRRLIFCQPQSVKNYLEYSEFLFKHYRIKEKLDSIEKS